MKKNNIIYIFGDNSAIIEQYKNRQIANFQAKYGKESVKKFLLDESEKWNEIETELLGSSLFEEKRMFVFSGGKTTSKWTKTTKKSKKTEIEGFEKILEKNFENISDTDFLIFHTLANGEENLEKWLKDHAHTIEYNLSWQATDWLKYTNLSEEIVKKILFVYQNAEKNREKGENNPFLAQSILATMKNIEILAESGKIINDELISELSHEYEWAKIFDFIDAIMAKNIKKALEMNKKFAENTTSSTIEIFFGSLTTLLKKNLYILTLKEKKFSKTDIAKILPWINPFILDKCLKSRISRDELAKIFKKIIDTNIAYRSGKWMKETILWRFFEIDTVLLSLKK